MKKAAIFFCLFLIAGVGVMAQVGINTDGTNPHSSAMLDVKSSTRGLLPPRMTHAEFLAIVSPANGLIVYCTDCGTDGNGAFYGYINGVWNKILTCFPPAMPGSGTHTASVNQIVWNWNAVEGASGYRWNTANNYSTALDLGNLLTKTETGLTCNTAYTRYVWSYNACDISAPVSLTKTTTQNPPVGITIAASANPVCSGTSVTFTATPTNGGTSPAYQWSKNGTAVSGATNATYTYPPLNNDAITCQLTSGIPCSQNNPALSNTITMAVNAVPAAPSAGTHVANQTQITWNWNPVTGATGYKWNTINDTATAINMGTLTTKTETSLSCSTAYTRYVWAYNICGTSTAITLTQTTSDCSGTFICGQSLTINHVAGAVAPVNKPTEYGTVTNVPGEPAKCWITSNLGSDHQATAVDDATEASAGWYWQFNRKQGYKHDGSNTTPSWPTSSIFENSDWIIENDPCHIELGTGWRIPTNIEWFNVDNVGGWNTGIDPWNSLLKLHYAGTIIGSSASLVYRGGLGYFWSNKQENNESGIIQSADSFHSYPNLDYKHYGESLRCVYENCVSPSSPTQGTHISTPTQIIWNWNTVTEATGYKWNTTNNYATATDMGTATTKTETGLTCNTTYTRYAWAYNACGSSTAVALNQTTLPSQLPNITISASSDSVCAGNQVTLTAITENPGINPTYQWFVNGVQINSGAGVSSSGLVAYYSFNGNADDLSGNGNNGIINGATSTTDRFGAQTSAFQFNGVNSYIEVPNAPSLIFGSNDFSLNAWIYPTAFNGNGGFNAILTKHNNDNNSWLFSVSKKTHLF
jgi:hypothetical protein